MKKILMVFAASMLLFACSSGDSPKDVAKNFLENMSKGNLTEAKKYTTESTGQLLEMASGFGSMPVDSDFKIVSSRDSIVGDKAWVFFTNQNGEEGDIELTKVDGKWKVFLDMGK